MTMTVEMMEILTLMAEWHKTQGDRIDIMGERIDLLREDVKYVERLIEGLDNKRGVR